jgi:copper chaperone NosL
LFVFPLWKITLVAPQYPKPLGMYIHIDHLSDGVEFNDVQNIDLLNHYIGMAHLPTKLNVKNGKVEPFLEFTIMPIVVALMALLGVVFGIIRKRKLYLIWVILLAVLGSVGVYDFYLWLYDYGHNLDPNAILKIIDPETGELMAYQPPIFGYKQLLNFDVYSYPASGVNFIAASAALAFLSFLVGKKNP